MTKFPIGSKVKIIKNESGLKDFNKYIGQEVKVVGISHEGDGFYKLPIPTKTNTTFWYTSELELVKPKAKKENKNTAWGCPKCRLVIYNATEKGIYRHLDTHNPPKKEGKIEKKPTEIVFQVLDPVVRKCACRGFLSNAIKHTKMFCYDDAHAVRIEPLDAFNSHNPPKKEGKIERIKWGTETGVENHYFLTKKLNELIDAWNSTKEEGK